MTLFERERTVSPSLQTAARVAILRIVSHPLRTDTSRTLCVSLSLSLSLSLSHACMRLHAVLNSWDSDRERRDARRAERSARACRGGASGDRRA